MVGLGVYFEVCDKLIWIYPTTANRDVIEKQISIIDSKPIEHCSESLNWKFIPANSDSEVTSWPQGSSEHLQNGLSNRRLNVAPTEKKRHRNCTVNESVNSTKKQRKEIILEPEKIYADEVERSEQSKPNLEIGMLWCPVSGCNNHRGKGFKDLVSHIHRQHKQILENEESEDKRAIVKSMEKLNRILCHECHRIKAKSFANGMCSSC